MLKKWIIYVQQIILYVQQIIFTFNKWFSYSGNVFHLFKKWLLYSANGFYIQQEIYIFSNLRFSFNKIKFIKLKSFTFSKPNLDVTKHTSKSIRQNDDLVCKLYIQSVFSHFSSVSGQRSLFSFTMLLVNELIRRIGVGLGSLVTCMWTPISFF